MRIPRLIFALVAVHLLADVAILSSRDWRDSGTLAIVIIFSVLMSQANLLAVWTIIGRGRKWLRLLLAALGYALLMFATPFRGADANDPLILVIAAQFIVGCITLGAMRLAGFGMRSMNDRRSAESEHAEKPLQFSILNLMQLTVIAAGITSLIVHLTIERPMIWEALWLAGACSLALPLVVVATLTVSTLWPRILVAICVCLIAIANLWFWPDPDRSLVVAIGGLQYFLVAASLLVVRLSGYRFLRPAEAVTGRE
jgi:hypothetical protein